MNGLAGFMMMNESVEIVVIVFKIFSVVVEISTYQLRFI